MTTINNPRSIILHYHLFKNAGTSIDKILKLNFTNKWITQEFEGPADRNRASVKEWVEKNPEAICFSSHTALLPPPIIANVNVIPVLFFRHPIDRIFSAYQFERKQTDSSLGSTLARNTTLVDYIKSRLAIKNDFQCQNFHMHRLASMYFMNEEQPLSKAKKAIETLPFVGIVENFDRSMQKLAVLLSQYGFENLNFTPVHENIGTFHHSTLFDRLEFIKETVGEDFYNYLLEKNAQDLELYEFATSI